MIKEFRKIITFNRIKTSDNPTGSDVSNPTYPDSGMNNIYIFW